MRKREMEKTKGIFLVLAFLAFSFVFAFLVDASELEPRLETLDELDLLMEISSTVHSDAEKLIINLTAFPLSDEKQQVELEFDSTEAKLVDNFLIFEFYEKGTINFNVKARIKSIFLNSIEKKTKKINLSNLKAVPEELIKFTEPSVYTVDDSFIKNKAQQLATDDALETIYRIAEYVRKNMEYNLEYQELENASWIMQEKKGVCSHYTILFMALVRSLNIPARYVSGVAYSNKEKEFREHAWAEVWLGEDGEGSDEGWIPFDITFRQYGWVDATHIIFKKSLDAGEASVEYRYIGKIEPQELKIETTIENYGEKINLPVELKAEPYLNTTSIYSYLPIKVTAKNLNNYYFFLPVHVSTAPGVFGETEKILFLKPLDETETFFIIYLENVDIKKCKQACIAQITIEDIFENSVSTAIRFEKGKTRIELEEAQAIVAAAGLEEKEIDFYCKTTKDFYYDYENITIDCIVENHANVAKELSVCNQDTCENFILFKNEKKEIKLEIPAAIVAVTNEDTEDQGIMKCLILCAIAREKKDVLGISCIDIVILKSPEIKIDMQKEAKEANYGDKDIQLIIESNTQTSAELIIEATEKKYSEKQGILIDKGIQTINIKIKTWKLNIGENPIHATLVHKDKNNKTYETKKDFILTVKDVSVFKKFMIRIIHLFDF